MFRKISLAAAIRRTLVLSALTTAAAPMASAQDQTDQADDLVAEVVVTGSRIARPDLEANSPVTVVGAESLQLAGTTSAEEFLRELPQLVPAIGSNTNNGNQGAATLDLRNLAEERTLVLVDGRRFIPYDSDGVVDTNMIPASLIDRVEIVTGGASAVYGSDAIAGVVNFILRDDFEGFATEFSHGQTQRGDGDRVDFSTTMGVNFADDRGNMVVNLGFTEQDAIYQGERGFSEAALESQTLSAVGSSTNAAGTVRGVLPGNGQPGGVYTWDASGNLIPYSAGRDSFNFNPFNLFQAPAKKWTATALATYDVNDSVEFFGRFSFANTQVDTIIAPSGTFNFPFVINYQTNAFLTDQARAVLARNDVDDPETPQNEANDGIVSMPFGRRAAELGTRDSKYENVAYQVVGGLRGTLAESWNWEVFGQHGRTSRAQNFFNDINFDRTQQGLLAVRDGNGNIVCSDPSGNCVPVNLFGAGTLSPEAAEYILLDLQQVDKTDQTVAGGFIGHDLPFTIPLASRPGAFVVGVEHRRESGEAKPDSAYAAGISPGFGQSRPLTAELSTMEAYGEMRLPLVSDRSFAHSLSLEAGIRYSDYENEVPDLRASNAFETTAWKAGGEWAPVESLRLRALYQRAVRAPNLNEIGDPRTNGTGDAFDDYCSSESLTPAQVADPANASLVALCIATGAPLSGLQGGSIGGPISGQISNYAGGNPGLVPENSDTVTYGVVWQPSFAPGLTASIDYFDIKVDKAILQTPEQAILDACYQQAQNPGLDASNPFCQAVHRNPLDGSLNGGLETGVDATDRNIGFLRSRGVDLATAYRFDFGNFGRIGLALNLTHQLESQIQFTENAPIYDCVGAVGDVCLRPTPEWRWVQTTTWARGPATLQLRWRHVGEVTQDSIVSGDAPASDFAVPTIRAYEYLDFGASYQLNETLTFRAGIDNLLDEKPPIVGQDYGGTAENSGNTFPATYDALGRSFFVSATMTF